MFYKQNRSNIFCIQKKVIYWHMIARRTFKNGCFRIFLLEVFFGNLKTSHNSYCSTPLVIQAYCIHIEYCYCKVLEIKLYFTLSTSGFPLKCHIASGVSLKSIGFCASLADVYFTMPGVTWVPSRRHCLSLLCKETGLSQVVLVAKALTDFPPQQAIALGLEDWGFSWLCTVTYW